jgi:hypothetical protein
MGGMRFRDALRVALALARRDLTVTRVGVREGTLLAEGVEI